MANSQTDLAISVTDLKKSYGKLQVIDCIDLSAKKGEVLALLGPNGAGKTTTVKILSTLLLPDSGECFINGYNVVKNPAEVRASIGLTGQYAAVDEYLTGKENLEMVGRLYRLSQKGIKERSEELLERFEMTEAGNRVVKTYSGGMRRKIDLAMSLIASPPVLFLDEPTTGLDPRSRLTMWAVIKELAATNVTILLTTQYMDEADFLADRITVIDRGVVIAEGTPDELKAKVGSDHIELIINETSNFEAASKVPGFNNIHIDENNRSLRIPTANGAEDLRKVLRYFDESKVTVESLSLSRPTLDDVFLSITGHTAEEEKNGNNNK
jgi:ABC-2 type transport system ATP-binding protein